MNYSISEFEQRSSSQARAALHTAKLISALKVVSCLLEQNQESSDEIFHIILILKTICKKNFIYDILEIFVIFVIFVIFAPGFSGD